MMNPVLNTQSVIKTLQLLAKTTLPLVSIVFAGNVLAETAKNLQQLPTPETLTSVAVTPLSSSAHSSEFVIFIKDKVKPHYHQTHTEIVYILAGEAKMTLDNETFKVSEGDMVKILPGTIHAVEVTSTVPLKVFSIQTPEFDGQDRIFVEP